MLHSPYIEQRPIPCRGLEHKLSHFSIQLSPATKSDSYPSQTRFIKALFALQSAVSNSINGVSSQKYFSLSADLLVPFTLNLNPCTIAFRICYITCSARPSPICRWHVSSFKNSSFAPMHKTIRAVIRTSHSHASPPQYSPTTASLVIS